MGSAGASYSEISQRNPSMREFKRDAVIEHASKLYDGTYFCHLAMVPLKSKTPSNPDRWFVRYLMWKDKQMQCKYFQWVDEIQEQTIDEEKSFGNNFVTGVADAKKKNSSIGIFRDPWKLRE